MMTSPEDKAVSKSDLIEGILRQHGTLPVRRIVEEMQLAGVDAKPNNVRSLMSTLFKRFVSLKPGLWQLQDPALGHAERVLAYEQSRGREVSSDMLAFLQTYDKPRAPSVPKLRNGDMKRNDAIKELNQLLQELEENKESLQVTIDTCQKKQEALQTTIDACHVVIGLFEERPPDDVFKRPPSDDDPVTTPEPKVERAPTDVVTTPQRASPGVFHEAEPKRRHVKRQPAGLTAVTKAPCPRCSATAVTTEDHFSICISCGWNKELT